jgi:glutathione synthase/RimK-type ligase-like ATP-grasp enzyme
MMTLKDWEDIGYRVVNPVDVLKLTSDKYECAKVLMDYGVNHPFTRIYNRGMSDEDLIDMIDSIVNVSVESDPIIIAKPLTSMEQGAQVKKIHNVEGRRVSNLRAEIEEVRGDKIVLQECVDYRALHRVIVIDHEALPYTFVDRVEWHPREWKVSVCLNRTTMRFNDNPDMPLLLLAESAQRAVNAEISFIDVFETHGGYTMSEINTACNLSIHERLAQRAGRKDWNIHYRIARYLVDEMKE